MSTCMSTSCSVTRMLSQPCVFVFNLDSKPWSKSLGKVDQSVTMKAHIACCWVIIWYLWFLDYTQHVHLYFTLNRRGICCVRAHYYSHPVTFKHFKSQSEVVWKNGLSFVWLALFDYWFMCLCTNCCCCLILVQEKKCLLFFCLIICSKRHMWVDLIKVKLI